MRLAVLTALALASEGPEAVENSSCARGSTWLKPGVNRIQIRALEIRHRDGLCADSTARFIAAIMLSGRAMPLPAILNAVPWSGLVRGNGNPSVTFTPLSNAWSFNGINP
jgi:hypothetical protein